MSNTAQEVYFILFSKNMNQASQFLQKSTGGKSPCKHPADTAALKVLHATGGVAFLLHILHHTISQDLLLPKVYWAVKQQTSPQVPSLHDPTVLQDPPAHKN